MKKSLLALAVLGAISGVASAQTSVSIYGVVDAGLTHERTGTASFNRLDSGNQSGSRLGFKGNEDLGGGLSAQFLLEEGFNVDTGSLAQNGLLYGRQAYLGLTGNFGQVRLGRQKTVMYDSILAVDPFGIANKGGMDRLFATNTIELANTATALRGVGRSNNTVAYFTPNIAGFTGEATYTFGEQAGGNRDGRQYGLSLNYAAGPLFVTLDYLNVNSVPAATIANSTAKTTFLGATYDFGIVKAHAAYGIDKGSVNVAPNSVLLNADQRDYMVGATVPFGASAVQLDYIRKLDRSGQDAGAKQYALGYTYALSKRTNFYSSYTGTTLNSVNYVANGVPGQIDRILNVGVRHTF